MEPYAKKESCGIGYQDSFCYRQRQEKCYVANDSPRFIDFVSIAKL